MANNQDNFNMTDLTHVLNDEDRAGLVNALKNKLQNLAGQHPDVLEHLAPKVRKRVDFLREMQSQHDELEKKFFEERAALEAKYQKLYQPIYTKRYEIVNGIVEVDGVANEAAMEQEDKDKEEEEKGVPEFWLTAMKNNEVLSEEITERDEGALKYLKDIKWCRIVEPKGFKLEFFFDPNPYFKNSVLTKTYHMIDEDEPILEKAIGTEIEWYPGKCLTQKILKKKPKKGSKNTKPITKTEECESFFNFFSPPQVPEDDEDIDEDTAEELQNQMEQDYDIGSTIKDKVIPHAVSWFTGEAIQGDELELDDDVANHFLIVAFDVTEENFVEIEAPNLVMNNCVLVTESPESLGKSLVLCDRGSKGEWKIWLMKEYGNSKSWTILYCIPPHPIYGVSLRPHIFLDDGEIVMVGDLMHLYDPKNQMYKCFDNEGLLEAVKYKESLVSVKGGGSITNTVHCALISNDSVDFY